MQFLYPNFLWALSALAIPVAIHLFNLRRPTRTVFTNVSFLREVKNSTNHLRQLKHLLILACRLVMLVALVLLFAQPFIPAKENSVPLLQQAVVYLDNSYSMQAMLKDSDESLLLEAGDGSARLATALPQSAQLQLLDNGFQSGGIRSNQKDFSAAVARIDFSGRYRPAANVVSRIERLQQSTGQATAFWFSDFQKSTFDPAAFAKADPTVNFQLVHLPSSGTGNLFIDTVNIEDAFIRPGDNNSLLVKLQNQKSEEVSTNVKFFMGNTQVSSLDVTLSANAASDVKFTFQLPNSEPQLCRIVVEDFPVTFDNEYFFVLKTSPDIRILTYGPKEVSAVRQVYSNEPVFKLNSVSAGKLNYEELANTDLIVLDELQTIEPGLADNIRRQVEAGSAVMIIPAGNADQNSYNQLLAALGISGARWVEKGELQALEAPDLNNPFFRNIFEKLPKGIETPKAAPLVSWSRSDANILQFRNGQPFLSQFRRGKGTVFIMAAPLAQAYSDLASNALFVPTMYKLAMRSQRTQQPLAYSFSQEVLEMPVIEQSPKEQVYKLVRDSIEYIPDQRITGNALVLTVPAEVAEAGFFSLQAPGGTRTPLALNTDKRESVLEQYSAEELRNLMAPYKNVTVQQASSGAAFADKYRKDNQGTPLWKYCLLICLIALAAETAIIRFAK